MMLCEDTISTTGVPPINTTTPTTPQDPVLQESIETKLESALSKLLKDVKIPQNKNARRRFINEVRTNIDKLQRGTQFKKNQRVLPANLLSTIKDCG